LMLINQPSIVAKAIGCVVEGEGQVLPE
jgi:hypothetical protein